MATTTSKYLFWCDIEATCKNGKVAKILEIAGIVTTKNLSPVARFHDVIHHERGALDPYLSAWSLDQHTRSGLLEECYRSTLSLREVEARLYAFLNKFRKFSDAFPFLTETEEPSTTNATSTDNKNTQTMMIRLAGSGIAFDRDCLEHEMPRVAEILHYQLLDVTSWLKGFNWWAPNWRSAKPTQMHRHEHRAVSDVEDSLHLMQFYRQCVLKLNLLPVPKS